MRKKTQLSDLKVLFVCPSDGWGTLERRVVQDSIYLRDSGAEPIVFCLPNSAIEKESKKQDIKTISYIKRNVSNKIDSKYYLFLRKVIKNQNFDIVHCYGLEYVWPLCSILKKYKLISLLLTVNEQYSNSYNTLLYRLLFSRIDRVITFDEFALDTAKMVLPIKRNRFEILGLGLEFKSEEEIRAREKLTWRIGCYLPQTLKSTKPLTSIFYTIRAILEYKEDFDKKIELVLFTDSYWNQSDFNKELRGHIMDMGLENNIRLENKIRPLKDLGEIDILLCLETGEPFFDYEINALIYKKPLISPRTSSRSSLLQYGKEMGETYKLGDSRELKNKLSRILSRYDDYVANIDSTVQQLRDIHSLESYADHLFELYIKLQGQRERLYQSKR